MSRLGALTVAWLACCASLTAAADAPTAVQPLMERMSRAGRGEAHVVISVATGSEAATSRKGTVALEPPDRMRLQYLGSKEALTARGDGGEWLQPELGQMLTMSAEQAQRAASLWQVMRSRSSSYVERKLGPSSWRVTIQEPGAEAESLTVHVGADHLPSKIETRVGDLHWTIQLSSWHFGKARGKEAFVLHAPVGYEVMPMP
jgi:outer membrane lipoprotein-sorting protein